VTTQDGGYTATCTVTVGIPVTGVTISPPGPLTLATGESKILTATVSPGDATNKAVKWTTSNPAVAAVTVSADGTVTVIGVAAGPATVWATSVDGTDIPAECAVTVEAASTALPDDCEITQYYFTNPDSIGDIGSGSGSASDPIAISISFWAGISGWSDVTAPAAREDDIKIKYTGTKLEAADGWTKTGGIFYRDYTVYASGNEKHYRVIAGPSFDIPDRPTWEQALGIISGTPNGTAASPRVFKLNIVGDFDAPGITASSITGTYKTVWLTGTKTISIDPSTTGGLIWVAANQTFVLDGPSLQGKAGNNAALVYINNSAVELRSGTINGNMASYGGGVQVNYGTFTMSGGTISGNTATNDCGGGVYLSTGGTFTMTGGTSSGNTTAYGGGGVFVGTTGTFTMSGGTISGNSATYGGGGVYVYGTFTMSGGTISGNTATSGGGVYVDGNYAIFTMSGGTISGNAASSGGGVYVFSGTTFTKTGGIIYGDTDNTHTAGSTENTATVTTNLGKNGHAVFLQKYSPTAYYYRNETLGTGDNISTTDPLPDDSGDTDGKWTKR
jgi:hypothetical protein